MPSNQSATPVFPRDHGLFVGIFTLFEAAHEIPIEHRVSQFRTRVLCSHVCFPASQRVFLSLARVFLRFARGDSQIRTR